MTNPLNYALFVFAEHDAGGAWNDFKAVFETMKEATETGQSMCDRGSVVQIVHLNERRILISGEWTCIPSTLTGAPVHSYFRWSEEEQM